MMRRVMQPLSPTEIFIRAGHYELDDEGARAMVRELLKISEADYAMLQRRGIVAGGRRIRNDRWYVEEDIYNDFREVDALCEFLRSDLADGLGEFARMDTRKMRERIGVPKHAVAQR